MSKTAATEGVTMNATTAMPARLRNRQDFSPSATVAPKCLTCGINECVPDVESGWFSSDCDRCFWLRAGSPGCVHTERYTPVQVAAGSFAGTWQTRYNQSPVFDANGVHVAWICEDGHRVAV